LSISSPPRCIPPLITLELGPESELERVRKLFSEVGQERLNRLDCSLLEHGKDCIPSRSSVSGVYERAITTPTGKLAVIPREKTFTLAPWKPLSSTSSWIQLRTKTAYAFSRRLLERLGQPVMPVGGLLS